MCSSYCYCAEKVLKKSRILILSFEWEPWVGKPIQNAAQHCSKSDGCVHDINCGKAGYFGVGECFFGYRLTPVSQTKGCKMAVVFVVVLLTH